MYTKHDCGGHPIEVEPVGLPSSKGAHSIHVVSWDDMSDTVKKGSHIMVKIMGAMCFHHDTLEAMLSDLNIYGVSNKSQKSV